MIMNFMTMIAILIAMFVLMTIQPVDGTDASRRFYSR